MNSAAQRLLHAFIGLAAVCAVAMSVLAAGTNAPVKRQSRPDTTPAVGTVAPEITATDVLGRKFSLSYLRGKVVVLDFWGDW